METELLKIENLSVEDKLQHKILNNINLTLVRNRSLAIVGESGSGKSTLSRAILGLLNDNLICRGQIFFAGKLIKNIEPLRGKRISLIVQHGMSAFDPLMTIEQQLVETLMNVGNSKSSALQHLDKALADLQLTPTNSILKSYPNELSGGQLQRLMLALNFIIAPDLVIADEPTSALDSTTQFELLPLFRKLAKQSTLLFITHDLNLARHLADETAVFKQGELIECQNTEDLFLFPQHPYTKHLLAINQQFIEHFKQVIG